MIRALDRYKNHVFLFLGNEQLSEMSVEVLTVYKICSVVKPLLLVKHVATPATAVFRQLKTNTLGTQMLCSESFDASNTKELLIWQKYNL